MPNLQQNYAGDRMSNRPYFGSTLLLGNHPGDFEGVSNFLWIAIGLCDRDIKSV
ncbi:hypothetical protein [Roseofilum casamattae]|uniref:Uncharacterized protein n=1 Tax=Roseofilum casamattae BLCC-M143 TaxID=3022442 RepID=A0ABT7BZB9_9CYAN|nr:hypothetical protein [Roseofilum casamattae]MDJ1184543.1 hypothetical protein [Roseofilum casamattae BLCC-M143]